jgi:histidyl-tRNA synthetase
MTPIRAIKGMNDVLPDDVGRWQRVERIYARTMGLHGFREVRTPLLEPTPLFVRAMGETTDVVEKEMYAFEHHGDAIALRPEGTAGAVRAYVEHSVAQREPLVRWWYAGPMFRAENTQRGRYRQFSQLGAEVFGDQGPGCDAEIIDMLVGFLREIEVPGVEVVVNSLGSVEARARYRAALVDYLTPKAATLSEDSRRRLTTNPLRILDSKDESDRAAAKGAPTLIDVLDAGDREHLAKLREALDALGTPYAIDPHLVRGLDYYTRTLFEIRGAQDKLGAGSTLVGGGRYDTLVKELGGPDVPAIGFAAGLERLLIASELQGPAAVVDVLVAPLGAAAVAHALGLARDLRGKGIRTEVDTRGTSLKSQLRRANGLGARMVLILGDTEIASGSVQVKDLAGHSQETLERDQAVRVVVDRLLAVAPPAELSTPSSGEDAL